MVINIAIDIRKGAAVVRFPRSWRVVIIYEDGRVIRKRGLWPGRLRRVFFWNVIVPVEKYSEDAVRECLLEIKVIRESFSSEESYCFDKAGFMECEDICDAVGTLYRRSMGWRWHIRQIFS